MNQEKIIQLAKSAGAYSFYPKHQEEGDATYIVSAKFLQRFANLLQDEVESDAYQKGFDDGLHFHE